MMANQFRQILLYPVEYQRFYFYPLQEKLPMNVSLTPELEQLVREKVASGLYQTASEVIRDALRLLKERDMRQSLPLWEQAREVPEARPLRESLTDVRGGACQP
jgi:putative addiction module CopG family antidote